jgi:hypothetical protein
MPFEPRQRRAGLAAAACCGLLLSPPAHAFGDEGHRIVALIAEHDLTPAVRRRVFAMLAADDSGLASGHDIASEATWADRYRDSDRNTTRTRFEQTRRWHFVDVEIDTPNLDAACFEHPPLPHGVAASDEPADACVVDKIAQFEHELAAPATSQAERLRALQFVLHLVGDLHQPLHASDDHDLGGNGKLVRALGRPAASLHHHWDTEFVVALGADPAGVAHRLIAGITPQQRRRWSTGTLADWAGDSFAVGSGFAYAELAAPQQGVRPLSAAYVKGATRLVARQLSKAGVRLAALLNRSLGAAPSIAPSTVP